MVDYHIFTREWLKRASDPKRKIDKGDRFICLWIAFNGWMKNKYGETEVDRNLIDQTKKDKELNNTFELLRNDTLLMPLTNLRNYTVTNMRYANDRSRLKQYNNSFESLIEVLYQIRCNLFHGRKNIDENRIDEKLVHLAYDILYPLFDEYLKRGNRSYSYQQ